MCKKVSRISRNLSFLIAAGTLLAGLLAAAPSRAADTGVLKLKVMRCLGSNWLSGATVDVVIYRPGSGQVDSASGTTNSSGYVEFTFTSLEHLDQAHVTVTPSGESPDSAHVYTWRHPDDRADVGWDLGLQLDTQCEDSWYSTGIFLCLYH